MVTSSSNFSADPFDQAAAEVKVKTMGDQILHSSMFHSIRSAFSSKGSFASKGASAALGVGKLFLALIPVPAVGSVVGAAADAINGVVRKKLHERHVTDKELFDARAVSDKALQEQIKFQIKELTVENLDRYRWKLTHSIEELNKVLVNYNNSNQSCDDMYAFCLLSAQVDRRRQRLVEELDKFKQVVDNVNEWLRRVDHIQFSQLHDIKEEIKTRARNEIQTFDAQPQARKAEMLAAHANCRYWCWCRKSVKYNPNTIWAEVKERSGQVANFLQPVAMSAIAVRQSDYTNDADNSKFTK